MGRKNYLSAVALVLLMSPLHSQDNIAAQIGTVFESLKTGDIASVEVFGIPPDTFFRTSFTPSLLEKSWDYKLTVRSLDLDMKSRAEALASALKSAAVQPTRARVDSLDVRWGVVFYSKTSGGRPIAAFYFDRSGRRGAVNGIPVTFGPDFLLKLKQALHAQID